MQPRDPSLRSTLPRDPPAENKKAGARPAFLFPALGQTTGASWRPCGPSSSRPSWRLSSQPSSPFSQPWYGSPILEVLALDRIPGDSARQRRGRRSAAAVATCASAEAHEARVTRMRQRYCSLRTTRMSALRHRQMTNQRLRERRRTRDFVAIEVRRARRPRHGQLREVGRVMVRPPPVVMST